MVTLHERLTAIGGRTRKVEVYEDGSWNDQIIPSVGQHYDAYDRYCHFTSLVIQSQLYVFGNIPVFNQD